MFKKLLPLIKGLLFSEAVKIVKKKIEDKDHAAKPVAFSTPKALLHGGKKGLPVLLAMEISRILVLQVPELASYGPALVAVTSGLLFVLINFLKKKYGLNLSGIL